MPPTHPAPAATAPKAWWHLSLTQQIVLGLLVGCAIGWWMSMMPAEGRQAWDTWMKVPRDVFLQNRRKSRLSLDLWPACS